MKKIAMIVASVNFRDEELFEPLALFLEKGYQVVVASSTLEVAKGMLGGSVQPKKLVQDVDPADYAAVIFVGGSGAVEYFDDPQAHALAQQTVAANKLLGAICMAPAILAKSGVLEGKTATVWSDSADTLKKSGVQYTGNPVEVDGLIVTADGPASAGAFGQAIVDLLEELKIDMLNGHGKP